MQPVWSLTDARRWPALQGETAADLLVIGAGYAGLVAALEARDAGLTVVVLEADQPGSGASGINAGHFAPIMVPGGTPERIAPRLGSQQGERWLSMVAASGDWLLKTIKRYGIGCDLRPGYLCVARTEHGVDRMHERFAAWAAYGGKVEHVGHDRLRAYVRSPRYAGGAVLADGGTLHPLKLAHGLADAADRRGIALFGDSRVTALRRAGGTWQAATPNGSVRARQVLIAAGAAGTALFPSIAAAAYRLTVGMAATEPMGDNARRLAEALLPHASMVDLDDPAVFSPTIDSDGRLTASFLCARTSVEAATRSLGRRFKRAFPGFQPPAFTRVTSGTIAVTPDGLPRIFRLGDGAWAVGGCNGLGLTLGITAAREAARLATGAPESALALPVAVPRPVTGHAIVPPLVRAILVPLLNRLGA